jgi:hypothetical protein
VDEKARDRLRTVGLLLGTLVLATAFIAAYVGALHRPTPRDVPVGVVRGDQKAQALLDAVRNQTDKIKHVGYADPGAADDGLTTREVYGVLASTAEGGLALTTASAAAPAAADVVVQVLSTAARQAELPLRVTDEVPVAETDPRGLVPFYLAVGYVLGGYLASTGLGLADCGSPCSPRTAWCSGSSARSWSGRSSASGTTTCRASPPRGRWRCSRRRWPPPRCRAGWACSAPAW